MTWPLRCTLAVAAFLRLPRGACAGEAKEMVEAQDTAARAVDGAVDAYALEERRPLLAEAGAAEADVWVELGRFALGRIEEFGETQLLGTWTTREDRLAAAQAALGRAVALDAGSADAHALLGVVRCFWPPQTASRLAHARFHFDEAVRLTGSKSPGRFLIIALLGGAFMRLHGGLNENVSAWLASPEADASEAVELLARAAKLADDASDGGAADALLALALLARRNDSIGAAAAKAAASETMSKGAEAMFQQTRAAAGVYGEALVASTPTVDAAALWRDVSVIGGMWRGPWQRPLELWWPNLEPEGWDGLDAASFDAYPELRRARYLFGQNWRALRDELLPLLELEGVTGRGPDAKPLSRVARVCGRGRICESAVSLNSPPWFQVGRSDEHALIACDGMAPKACPIEETPVTCGILALILQRAPPQVLGERPPGSLRVPDSGVEAVVDTEHTPDCSKDPLRSGLAEVRNPPPIGALKLLRASLRIVYPNGTSLSRHKRPKQGRLRLHCSLVVPRRLVSAFYLGEALRSAPEGGIRMHEGDCFWFDESYEYRATLEGSVPRVFLTIDVVHPGFYHRPVGTPLAAVAITPLPFSPQRFAQLAAARGRGRAAWPPRRKATAAPVGQPRIGGNGGLDVRNTSELLVQLFGRSRAAWTISVTTTLDVLAAKLGLLLRCLEVSFGREHEDLEAVTSSWVAPALGGWRRALAAGVWGSSTLREDDLQRAGNRLPTDFAKFLRWWAQRVSEAEVDLRADGGADMVCPSVGEAMASYLRRHLSLFNARVDALTRSFPRAASLQDPAFGFSFQDVVVKGLRPVVGDAVQAQTLLQVLQSGQGVPSWEAADRALWGLANLSHCYAYYLHSVFALSEARRQGTLAVGRVQSVRFHVDLGGRRWEILVALLRGMAQREDGRIRIAEIGVCDGATASYLLRSVRQLEWLGVDCYESCGHCGARERKQAIAHIAPFADRANLYVAHANEEIAADGRLFDMVFVDAGHSFEDAARDLKLWAPRVRPGGIVAGHDYMDPVAWDYGVIRAVNEALPEGRTLHLAPDFMYWWQK